MKKSLALITLISTLIAFPSVPARAAPARPNIIFILSDDQTVDTLRAMPNVRSLLTRQGTRYTSAYISNPICCPSRASFLTGLYSHSNLTYTNFYEMTPPREPWHEYGGTYAFHDVGNNEQRTLAYALQEGGYHTGLVGKYLNGYNDYADAHGGPTWKPQGWDEWVAFYEKNGLYYNYDLDVNGRIQHFDGGAFSHSTRVLGDKAVRFVQKAAPKPQPFFLFFAPFAPHGSFTPERRDVGRYARVKPFDSPAVGEDVSDKPSYIKALPTGLKQSRKVRSRILETVYGLDRQVGRIIGALGRRELANTLIIYTSDNGQANYEHNWPYKVVPYERVIKVPFIMRGPGIPAGVTDNSFVLNVDVMPTILNAAGLPLYPSDGGIIPTGRDEFLLESMYYPRGKGSVPTYCGIVTHDWKYVVYSPNDVEPELVSGAFEEELYDRRADPYELENVASARPEIVSQLRGQLASLCNPAPPDTTPEWWNAWATGG